MERFLNKKSASYPLFEKFGYFTAAKINNSVKTKQKAPSHAFFNLCDELAKKSGELAVVFDKYITYLKKEFIPHKSTQYDLLI